MLDLHQWLGVTAIADLGIDGRNDDQHPGPGKQLLYSREENFFTGLAAFAVELVISEGQLMTHVGVRSWYKRDSGGTMSRPCKVLIFKVLALPIAQLRAHLATQEHGISRGQRCALTHRLSPLVPVVAPQGNQSPLISSTDHADSCSGYGHCWALW